VPQNTHPAGAAITSLKREPSSSGISVITVVSSSARQIFTAPRFMNNSSDPSAWMVDPPTTSPS